MRGRTCAQRTWCAHHGWKPAKREEAKYICGVKLSRESCKCTKFFPGVRGGHCLAYLVSSSWLEISEKGERLSTAVGWGLSRKGTKNQLGDCGAFMNLEGDPLMWVGNSMKKK